MKRTVFLIFFNLLWFTSVAQTITGIVTDENKQPLPFVNLYIEGTMEGTTSGENGRFELRTDLRGELKLVASFIGYTSWTGRINTERLSELNIRLKPRLQSIREVVALAGNYLLKSASTLEQKNAVDLITTGGSKGDLFAAISLLPGTQAPGIDGRILVRGGDSRESQTYIDDMQWYHTLTNPKQRVHWEKPYRNHAGQSLLRQLAYEGDNVYTASTFKTRLAGGFNLFAGIAWSMNDSKVEEYMAENDRLRIEERELHLKAKAAKRFSSFYKLELGAESYLRRYGMQYSDSYPFDADIKYRIHGLFVSNDFNLNQRLFLNLSSRLEYTSSNRSYAVLPRLALSYEWKHLTVSGAMGKYQQMADHKHLIHESSLTAEQNLQYLLGGYFTDKNSICRVEVYHKTYDKLPAIRNGQYSSAGSGYSRGIDVFLNDHTPAYNTLDISWTLLAHKKLIVYACLSNVLNRKNVFGYAFPSLPDSGGRYESLPVRQEQNQAFYIGVFLTLGKQVAYEASNF
jgi:hypothetical protein